MPSAFIQSNFSNHLNHTCNYIDYIALQGALFSPDGEENTNDAILQAIENSKSQAWMQIWSMRYSDYERLSLDRNYYKNLLATKRIEIARAYNINPRNLVLYASLHVKDWHPHLHLIFWSKDPREGFVRGTKEDKHQGLKTASYNLKSVFSNTIFSGDDFDIKVGKAAERELLKQEIQEQLRLAVKDASVPQNLVTQYSQLKKELKTYYKAHPTGKKIYGYLSAELKMKVNATLRTLLSIDGPARTAFLQYAESQAKLTEKYADSKITLAQKREKWTKAFFEPRKDGVTTYHNLIISSVLGGDGHVIDVYKPKNNEEGARSLLWKMSNDLDNDTERTAKAYIANGGTLRKTVHEMLDQKSELYDPSKAVALLESLAAPDSPWAQHRLAQLYISGTGIPRDIEKGFKLLTSSAKAGYSASLYSLGCLYLNGNIVSKDFSRAVRHLEPLAEKGDLHALYALGYLYLKGDGNHFLPDCEKALGFLNASIEENHVDTDADPGLTNADTSDDDIFPDDELAIESSYDTSKAIQWLFRASSEGHEYAQYKLGKMYLCGDCVHKNVSYGLQLLMQAAEQNNQWAQYQLGKEYLYGENVQINPQLAIAYLSASAGQKNQWAQYSLGKLLLEDKLVSQNIPHAISFLEASAKQGNAAARYRLGCVFLSNKFVDRDVQRALDYLIPLAYTENNQFAQYRLGKLYLRGTNGFAKNYDEGVRLLNISANQGFQPAAEALKADQVWRENEAIRSASQTVKGLAALLKVLNPPDPWEHPGINDLQPRSKKAKSKKKEREKKISHADSFDGIEY